METIKQACERWVNGFNAIPESVVEKLNAYDQSIREITPLTVGDRVYSTDPDWMWKEGEIVETKCDGEKDLYAVPSMTGSFGSVTFAPGADSV